MTAAYRWKLSTTQKLIQSRVVRLASGVGRLASGAAVVRLLSVPLMLDQEAVAAVVALFHHHPTVSKGRRALAEVVVAGHRPGRHRQLV